MFDCSRQLQAFRNGLQLGVLDIWRQLGRAMPARFDGNI